LQTRQPDVRLEILTAMGYDTMWCCGRIPTFQRVMLYPSLDFTLKMKAA
jgi:hypothetical protein